MSISFENHTTIFQTGGPKTVELGRIEPVSLHTVWRDDTFSFNQWLAQQDNLALLSHSLELELQLISKEGLRSNVFCREVGRDHEVLISTQLDKTDNAHLGELLTYASGINAFSIVWISRRIGEEHRACLDWLNRITGPEISFYGVELELWRIENSKPAPKFNVVVRPNEWAKATDAAAQDTSGNMLRYWTSFYDYMLERPGKLKPTKAYSQAWMSFHPFQRNTLFLNAMVLPSDKKVGVTLELTGNDASSYLDALAEHKSTIEAELGELSWKRGASGRECRVAKHLDNADPANEVDWGRQHQWMAQTLEAFCQTFEPLLIDQE